MIFLKKNLRYMKKAINFGFAAGMSVGQKRCET